MENLDIFAQGHRRHDPEVVAHELLEVRLVKHVRLGIAVGAAIGRSLELREHPVVGCEQT